MLCTYWGIDNVGEAAAGALFGPVSGALVAFFVLVSILGTLNATVLVGPRIEGTGRLIRRLFRRRAVRQGGGPALGEPTRPPGGGRERRRRGERCRQHHGRELGGRRQLPEVAVLQILGEFGDTCLYLASPLSSYVSGANILMHGGGEMPAYLSARKNESQ